MADGQARTFLDALYPAGLPDGSRLLIWTLPDKSSYWCDTIEQAVQVSEQQARARQHVYIGAGLGKPGLNRRQRTTNATVVGMPGVWIDIDYADGDAHKKTNLPTRAEAQALIQQLADTFLVPSLVIHSGHGYQAWWLFPDTWIFADDAERTAAGELQRQWVYALRDVSRAHGWDIDATIDLARVMRVAGTINYKGEPVPVDLTSNLQKLTRYPREQFAQVLADVPALPGSTAAPAAKPNAAPTQPQAAGEAVASAGGLVLDPAAEPPFDKWAALQDADVRVLRTWKRQRRDFKDTSASAYDMSLASFGVLASWDDQEITNLLIACRRYHNDDLKLREDYYARTIERARRTLNPQMLGEASGDRAEAVQAALESKDPTTAAQALSEMFGVRIERLIKYVGDPPKYVLELMLNGEIRSITLGGIEGVINQRSFRNAIAATVNLIIPSTTAPQWEKRAQALLNIIDEEELGPESSPSGVAREWVSTYLQQNRPSEDWQSALQAGRPFIKDGYVCITLQGLGLYLRNVQGEHLQGGARELARYLRMADFEQHSQYIEEEGKSPTSKSVWRQKQT